MKLILDTNSLRNFRKYYCFDKYSNKIQYNKLFDFIKKKIQIGEIIIIDKVKGELFIEHVKEFEIKKVFNTDMLIPEVSDLANDTKNYNPNYKQFIKTPEEVETEREDFINKYADLYLIGLAVHLKKTDKDGVFLITDETINEVHNKKLYKKIPSICKDMKIDCKSINYMLFTLYSNELSFSIEVTNI